MPAGVSIKQELLKAKIYYLIVVLMRSLSRSLEGENAERIKLGLLTNGLRGLLGGRGGSSLEITSFLSFLDTHSCCKLAAKGNSSL